MRLECTSIERSIPAFLEVRTQLEVAVPQKTFCDHQILGLVAIRAHPRLGEVRDRRIDREERGDKKPSRRCQVAAEESEDEPGERESEERRTRKQKQGCGARHRSHEGEARRY